MLFSFKGCRHAVQGGAFLLVALLLCFLLLGFCCGRKLEMEGGF